MNLRLIWGLVVPLRGLQDKHHLDVVMVRIHQRLEIVSRALQLESSQFNMNQLKQDST